MRNPGRGAVGAITLSELLFNLKRVAPWLLVALFSGNALLWWSAGPASHYGWAVNSDYYIARMCGGFTFLTVPFFIALMMGDPVIRDYRYEVAPLLFSKPISRGEYLLGKFFGNLFALMACSASFVLTQFLLQHFTLSGVNVLPWRVFPYLKHFFMIVVISSLPLAAFCFMAGTLTRSVKLVYGLVIALYVVYIATMATLVGRFRLTWIKLIDPLMFDRVNEMTKNLRPAELNQIVISYTGEILFNRLFTLAVAASLLLVLYLRFSMSERARKSSETGVLGLAVKTERLYDEGPSSHQALLSTDARSAVNREGGSNQTIAIPRVSISPGGVGTRAAQFAAAVGAEFRLLAYERGLIILVPLLIFLCSLDLHSFGPAYGSPLVPLSSGYAANSVRPLLILLCGVIIFYTGEMIHRDRELRVEAAIWSKPVPDWVLLLSKFAAILLLALGLVLLVGLTAIILQLFRGSTVDLFPYLIIYTVILLPTLVFMTGAAVTLNVLLRDKYIAHAVGIAASVGLFYLLSQGHNNWLWNPVLYGLWTYSDMSGLEPYRTGLLLHRIYWLAFTVAGLALAHYFFRRNPVRRRANASRAAVAAAAVIVAVVAGFAIKREINRGEQREWWPGVLARYEKQFAEIYRDAPQPEWSRVDLRVELDPLRSAFFARASFELVNRGKQPVKTILVLLNPNLEWQKLEIEGARIEGVRSAPLAYELARVYQLAAELEPGAKTTLRAEWTGVVPQGLLASSSSYATFVLPGGTYLGSPDITWLPVIGYMPWVEIADEQIRKKHGLEARASLPDLKDAKFVPSLTTNNNLPFDIRIEITVPDGYTALSSGRLVETRDLADRRTFVYESDHPLNRFPVLAAPYAVRRRDDFAVYFHAGHHYNVERFLDLMETARNVYERDYGRLPLRDLSIAEFPGLASFAMSHAGVMAFSEGESFLSREVDGYVNSNCLIVAHELAHQWFGVMVTPGRSKGAGVLSEGLAQYSAGALIAEKLGERAAIDFRKHEEATYFSRRAVEGEPPLAMVDESHPSQGVIIYQKAGLVFHMLERLIGREKMNAALKEYVSQFGWRETHPTIHDLIRIFKRQTPAAALDWFYDQWFYGLTSPDCEITSATMRQDGRDYLVEFTASNAGEGKMPVMIEAADDNQKTSSVSVVVENGRETRGVIRCSFKPRRVVLDPAHDVIDSSRANNLHTF
jgi:ABC-2 type transport system permease protein